MLVGNVTLTFKQLSEEKPPDDEYVLIANRDGQFFVIASLMTWDEDTPDEHQTWDEYGTERQIDLDDWPTWAQLPFKE